MSKHTLISAVSVVVATCTFGCSGTTEGPDGLANQEVFEKSGASELVVIESDPSSGKLVATFRRNERELTFEMRLGAPMEVPPLESEGAVPRMMNDARVLDQDGQALYVQMGADEFIDPTWTIPALENIDEVRREEDFAMLEASAQAFLDVELPSAFEDLRLNALQIAGHASERGAKTEGADFSHVGQRGIQANLVQGLSTVAYWDYRIYRKAAFVAGSPFDHTAVQLRGWNSAKNSVLFTAVSCNHGACAATASVAVRCTMAGWLTDDGTHSRYFYNEPSGSSSVTSGCSTSFSPMFDNGGHVCNDDTILQINAIKFDRSYNRAVGVNGECADTYANYWAPNCI